MHERPSDRVRVRRGPEKGRYDQASVHAVLDRGLVAHLAFVDGEGQPICLPMLYVRAGEQVLLHGSSASRAMRTLGAGAPVCLTVTLLDGLVFARSAYEHSANYQSAVLFGVCRAVTGADELREALEMFTERLLPGRWSAIRQPSELELRATHILEFEIQEAAVKVRAGGPDDDDSEDAELPVWAGHVPLRLTYGDPVDAEGLRPGLSVPDSVNSLSGTSR